MQEKNLQKGKRRIDFLDASKGIGILLVILGHILTDKNILLKFIYAFHMPLFFIIAGYVFRIGKYRIASGI